MTVEKFISSIIAARKNLNAVNIFPSVICHNKNYKFKVTFRLALSLAHKETIGCSTEETEK